MLIVYFKDGGDGGPSVGAEGDEPTRVVGDAPPAAVVGPPTVVPPIVVLGLFVVDLGAVVDRAAVVGGIVVGGTVVGGGGSK